MALTEVRVTGTMYNPDGTALLAGGQVIFRLSGTLLDTATGQTFPPVPIQVSLDSAGRIVGVDGLPGVLLVATDDPAASPSGLAYNVLARLNRTIVPPFQITVTSAAPVVNGVPTIDLAAITGGLDGGVPASAGVGVVDGGAP